ncbi:spermidine/putrescine ABC transporter substrate-binding protein [Hahella sp. CCB-MM4]|uniref:polyamine ABC transporter substrate-binding protein n=1 Tax=Hahella sp. (strain CCB-MM4) TaxID=1926491 RepID=UPI001FF03DB4|nr:spermidine/putrescine ABC transporter substrate-binding protein [Hahella sp. CCB-MM4]
MLNSCTNRIISLGRLALLLLAIFTRPAWSEELLVLTWEDYIDPELVTQFEEQTNSNIRFLYYEDDDERDFILANTEGSGFDLIVFDETMSGPYSDHGWLLRYPRDELPNLKYVRMPLTDSPLEKEITSVPYSWGSIGILYRKDKIPSAPTSWMDFFRPEESLRNRILVINTASTTFRMALKALGYSIHSENPEHIAQARNLMLEQRPYVRAYRNILFGEDSEILAGEAWMAMAYNGDAMTIMENHPELNFVIPREGSILWTDSIAILNSSSHKPLAKRFIDFMNNPENNAQNAEYIQYATPNTAAMSILPKEFMDNPIINPPRSAGLEVDKIPSSDTMRDMIKYFMELNP